MGVAKPVGAHLGVAWSESTYYVETGDDSNGNEIDGVPSAAANSSGKFVSAKTSIMRP